MIFFCSVVNGIISGLLAVSVYCGLLFLSGINYVPGGGAVFAGIIGLILFVVGFGLGLYITYDCLEMNMKIGGTTMVKEKIKRNWVELGAAFIGGYMTKNAKDKIKEKGVKGILKGIWEGENG